MSENTQKECENDSVCTYCGVMIFCMCTHRYDRNKLMLKEVHNVQYVSCMNPTAGSFTINPRLQVHSRMHAHTQQKNVQYT